MVLVAELSKYEIIIMFCLHYCALTIESMTTHLKYILIFLVSWYEIVKIIKEAMVFKGASKRDINLNEIPN